MSVELEAAAAWRTLYEAEKEAHARTRAVLDDVRAKLATVPETQDAGWDPDLEQAIARYSFGDKALARQHRTFARAMVAMGMEPNRVAAEIAAGGDPGDE